MTLFISDIHFGRDDRAAERANEAALIACLRAHEPDVERLYLVGDVFDQYIEYRHLVPKGFVRFQGLLAAWADRGVAVTYLVGNHDPWHRDYFEQELGVRVVSDRLVEPIEGLNVHLAHGDGVGSSRFYRVLRPWLRHVVPVELYRTLLPGDAGMMLASWAKRRLGNEEVQPAVVEALRAHARRLLARTPAEVVVLGHSHRAELVAWPEGRYLNTGCWHDDRTYGCLRKNELQLLHWNGTFSVELNSVAGR